MPTPSPLTCATGPPTACRPWALSRADGKPSIISDRSRNTILNYVRKILRHALDTGDADRIGLDRGFIVALPHGGPMTQRTRRPFTDEIARALADPGNLAQLAGTFDPSDRGIRDIWETIIATGRRVQRDHSACGWTA